MSKPDLAMLAPRRVCLIKPSSLGDVVHALPVLSSLRERWPGAHLAWVVNRGLAGLLDGHPHLNEVIPFDRGAMGLRPQGVKSFLAFGASLRARDFDLTIDLQGLFRSGLLTALTSAPVRVGLAHAREGAPWFYTHKITPAPHQVHAVDKLMAVASAFAASPRARFIPTISDGDRAWAERALRSVPKPRLVINVGARWLTKRWPPASFAEVAASIAKDRGAGIVIVGAPEDRPLVDELIARLDSLDVCDLAGKTSLGALAAIFAAADCVLSNDTGPLHLAAATGTPVVGVYTCTKPEKTGPYGPTAVAVASQIWCAGRCVKSCDRLDCMTELRPERVIHAVQRQLDAIGKRAAS